MWRIILLVLLVPSFCWGQEVKEEKMLHEMYRFNFDQDSLIPQYNDGDLEIINLITNESYQSDSIGAFKFKLSSIRTSYEEYVLLKFHNYYEILNPINTVEAIKKVIAFNERFKCFSKKELLSIIDQVIYLYKDLLERQTVLNLHTADSLFGIDI